MLYKGTKNARNYWSYLLLYSIIFLSILLPFQISICIWRCGIVLFCNDFIGIDLYVFDTGYAPVRHCIVLCWHCRVECSPHTQNHGIPVALAWDFQSGELSNLSVFSTIYALIILLLGFNGSIFYAYHARNKFFRGHHWRYGFPLSWRG